jgi:UDP-2,3-diacylglucosamine hydrolase
MQRCGAVLLHDPTVLRLASEHIALAHGDALCLGDTDYQQFRQVVRSASWQADFLAKPLTERQALARGMRAASESLKQAGSLYADVDTTAAVDMLNALSCQHLIHGHTHRPSIHDLGGGLRRTVLSDWVSGAAPPRGDVLRLELSNSGAPTWSRLTPAR